MDLECVASFLVLLEERHYGRAAARLHLTSSALTKRLQRLQRDVGADLVTRDFDGAVVATAAGRRFRHGASRLVADAELVRQSVVDPDADGPHVTVGVPAGPADFLRPVLTDAVRRIRWTWPTAQVSCRPVAFPALRTCVVDGEVDLLVTAAPVRHTAVASAPLNATVARIGLVHARHDLATHNEMPVADFAALPMLYNPMVPEEWMSVFYLGDIRPRTDAHLISSDPRDMVGVLREAERRQIVTVGPALFAGRFRPYLREVRLADAPPMIFHGAMRKSERRGPVLDLLAALQAVRFSA